MFSIDDTNNSSKFSHSLNLIRLLLKYARIKESVKSIRIVHPTTENFLRKSIKHLMCIQIDTCMPYFQEVHGYCNLSTDSGVCHAVKLDTFNYINGKIVCETYQHHATPPVYLHQNNNPMLYIEHTSVRSIFGQVTKQSVR